MPRQTKSQKRRAQFSLDIKNILSLEPDTWGHFKLHHNRNLYRIKLQKTSFRIEIKRGSHWVRQDSGFYSQIPSTLVAKQFYGCRQA